MSSNFKLKFRTMFRGGKKQSGGEPTAGTAGTSSSPEICPPERSPTTSAAASSASSFSDVAPGPALATHSARKSPCDSKRLSGSLAPIEEDDGPGSPTTDRHGVLLSQSSPKGASSLNPVIPPKEGTETTESSQNPVTTQSLQPETNLAKKVSKLQENPPTTSLLKDKARKPQQNHLKPQENSSKAETLKENPSKVENEKENPSKVENVKENPSKAALFEDNSSKTTPCKENLAKVRLVKEDPPAPQGVTPTTAVLANPGVPLDDQSQGDLQDHRCQQTQTSDRDRDPLQIGVKEDNCKQGQNHEDGNVQEEQTLVQVPCQTRESPNSTSAQVTFCTETFDQPELSSEDPNQSYVPLPGGTDQTLTDSASLPSQDTPSTVSIGQIELTFSGNGEELCEAKTDFTAQGPNLTKVVFSSEDSPKEKDESQMSFPSEETIPNESQYHLLSRSQDKAEKQSESNQLFKKQKEHHGLIERETFQKDITSPEENEAFDVLQKIVNRKSSKIEDFDHCDDDDNGHVTKDNPNNFVRAENMKNQLESNKVEMTSDHDGISDITGLVDVYQLRSAVSNAEKTLNKGFKKYRHRQYKVDRLHTYLAQLKRESEQLSHLLAQTDQQSQALHLETQQVKAALAAVSDVAAATVSSEGLSQRLEPTCYRRYVTARTSAEAANVLTAIRNRRKALNDLEILVLRKQFMLQHVLPTAANQEKTPQAKPHTQKQGRQSNKKFKRSESTKTTTTGTACGATTTSKTTTATTTKTIATSHGSNPIILEIVTPTAPQHAPVDEPTPGTGTPSWISGSSQSESPLTTPTPHSDDSSNPIFDIDS